MARLIAAKELERQIKEAWKDSNPVLMGQMLRWVRCQKTVDSVEVVHGRWVDVRGIPSVNRKNVPIVKCSKCEIYFCDLINNHHYMYHYCPNCGAKMDLEER